MKRWLALLGVFIFASVAGAQTSAILRGRVTDASGAAIGEAKIKLTLVTTGVVREIVTDTGGTYEFSQLQPGRYTVEVSADGFQTQRREALDLLVSTTTNVDIALGVQSAKQQVVVTAETAPPVNTSDATLGNAFGESQVANLPIEGRNVVELLSLQPGVTFLGKIGNDDGDSRSGAVNGARSDQSNVTLDGVDVNDQNKGYAFNSVLRMTQDSVEEFRVTTSNPNADAGRGSGAQVTLVTKSGTNAFHGSVYEYNRNALYGERLFQQADPAGKRGAEQAASAHPKRLRSGGRRPDQEGQVVFLLELRRTP